MTRQGKRPKIKKGRTMKKMIGMLMLAALATGVGAAEETREAAGDKPEGLYLVIDLSGGPEATRYPVSYLDAVPDGGWTDEYKTTKLVMRRIPAGTFTMGSPEGELGRWDDREGQRQVTLTKDYYMGVFQVTQRQWELVMGNKPSHFNNATYFATRPVERVSYNMIRGANAGSRWPADNGVDAISFMGRLRARTGLDFDLPTEAQWEYACRAGTTTALNSGKNTTTADLLTPCPHVAEVGRYSQNHPGGYSNSSGVSTDGGTAKVGSYTPNAWGLYDMHGNVWEWCLDWYTATPPGTTNPVGAASGSYRVGRGGCWGSLAGYCRSACRGGSCPDYRYNYGGFRLSRTLP